MIVARSKVAAQDAVELVDVDYDPLPVVLDMEEAVKDGANLCHDHCDSNTSYHFVFDAGEAGTGATPTRRSPTPRSSSAGGSSSSG